MLDPCFLLTLLHKSPFFFFNDTATTEIYTLSLHDALPILFASGALHHDTATVDINPLVFARRWTRQAHLHANFRSEEHTSELQSLTNLVCRLLLEKKKTLGPKRLTMELHIAIARSSLVLLH